VHEKEVKKLTDEGKEIGKLVEDTVKTLEGYKKQAFDYKSEL
jgi:hypothetical protein